MSGRRRLRRLHVRKGLLFCCPECGARRAKRQIWRHFGLIHPYQTFRPLGRGKSGQMWWAVGSSRKLV